MDEYIENIIKKEIHKIVKNNKRINDYCIIPYGAYGKYAEAVLVKKYKKNIIKVDNKCADNNEIFDIKSLKSMYVPNKFIFIIACYDSELIQNLFKQLMNQVFGIEKNDVYILFDNKRCIDSEIFLMPRGKAAFVRSIQGKQELKLLDVGCGNNGALYIKNIIRDIYYIGLDVCNYNSSSYNHDLMDEYYIVDSQQFANKIFEYKNSLDIVISAHNIEHCDDPINVINGIASSLKSGGRLYMSFPSKKSVNLPSREGTLNFFDDSTHVWVPKFSKICRLLEDNNMEIEYSCKSYRPFHGMLCGLINEGRSKKNNKVLKGTWALYGFEAIIWARKK